MTLRLAFIACLVASAVAEGQGSPFDGRVRVSLAESWPAASGVGLPELSLGISSIRYYPNTSNQLHEHHSVSGNTLQIVLDSVTEYGPLTMTGPATAKIPIGTGSAYRSLPRYIQISYGKVRSDLELVADSAHGRLKVVRSKGGAVVADSSRVLFVQPGMLTIGCFAEFMNPGLCQVFRSAAANVVGVTPRPLAADEISALGAELFRAPMPLNADTLRALSRAFVRTFDGTGFQISYAPEFMVDLAFWDGRQYSCRRGKCAGYEPH